jgi:hypothetical protein
MSTFGKATGDLVPMHQKLSPHFARLTPEEQSALEKAFKAALSESQDIQLADLWDRESPAMTYWILLMSGVNQPDEMKIAQDLLSWQAFFSKHSARVQCVQSSERVEFRLCSSEFDIADCPALILSDRPDMKSYIRLEAQLLFTLLAENGGLQRFLTRVHAHLENGRTLQDIDGLLASDKFWRGLKVAYKEVKGLVSISVALK